MLAAQFAENLATTRHHRGFVIVEQGAHHGELAQDFLEATRRRCPEFFAALRYQIVEPFPKLQIDNRKRCGNSATACNGESHPMN